MIDRRRHFSILDVRSFRGADCDTDHYLVVAKLRERLAIRKQAAKKFEGERFNLRKLKGLEVKEKYQIEITNRFAALENLNIDEDVSSNGAPWARPGAMPRGPKWGGANFAPPPKKGPRVSCPFLIFQPKLLLVGVNLRVGLPIFE